MGLKLYVSGISFRGLRCQGVWFLWQSEVTVFIPSFSVVAGLGDRLGVAGLTPGARLDFILECL